MKPIGLRSSVRHWKFYHLVWPWPVLSELPKQICFAQGWRGFCCTGTVGFEICRVTNGRDPLSHWCFALHWLRLLLGHFHLFVVISLIWCEPCPVSNANASHEGSNKTGHREKGLHRYWSPKEDSQSFCCSWEIQMIIGSSLYTFIAVWHAKLQFPSEILLRFIFVDVRRLDEPLWKEIISICLTRDIFAPNSVCNFYLHR